MEIDLTIDKEELLPPRLVLFGGPGVGKTTFGTKCQKPVFILTEDGCPAYVPRIPKIGKIEKWEDILAAIGYLVREDHGKETCILDVANGAEVLCRDYICSTKFGGNMLPGRGKEAYMQWGQGDKLMQQEFIRLLNGLDMLRTKKKMFVVLLTHEGLHRQGNALGDDFLKIGGAMHKLTWASVMEWSDQIGHITKDHIAVIKQGDKVAKRRGSNKRICYFEGGPGRDAKARTGYEMPESIEFSYENYIKASKWNPHGSKGV